MKRWIAILALIVISGFLGFVIGRGTADQREYNAWKSNQKLHAVAVDCYDAQGNLMPDPFAKFGGVRLECPEGQIARLHQASH